VANARQRRFHYSLNEHAITTWSRVIGSVDEAPTIWISHRAATRRRQLTPRPQPGWYLDRDGRFPLDEPLTLNELRGQSDNIRAILEGLKSAHPGSLYFPFFFWGGTTLRPMQPYLNKLPVSFLSLFPKLQPAFTAAVPPRAVRPPDEGNPPLGAPYQEAYVNPLQVGDSHSQLIQPLSNSG
jgi:hypothetical protein